MRLFGIIIILLLIGFGVRWIGHAYIARSEAERLMIAHKTTQKSLEMVIAENKQLQADHATRESELQDHIETLQTLSIDEHCQKCVLVWD